MKKPLSLDLRERIVAAYEGKEGTREALAKRFNVSEGLVKKLVAQQKRTGDLRPRYRFCGRKARLEPEHGKSIRQLVEREPDVTLGEIKRRLGLDYTIGAIHWVLKKLGLTLAKRRSMRRKKSGSAPRKGGASSEAAKSAANRSGVASSKSSQGKRK